MTFQYGTVYTSPAPLVLTETDTFELGKIETLAKVQDNSAFMFSAISESLSGFQRRDLIAIESVGLNGAII